LAAAFGLVLAGGAFAQRGMGDPSGVARWDEVPPLQTVAGTVADVRVEACEQTTGPADLGAHVLLDAESGTVLNVHLGPFVAVEDLVGELAEGASVDARAFRTEAMPEHHYVAVELTVDDETTRLRNPDDLQPLWARGPRAGRRFSADDAAGTAAADRARGREVRRTDRCWWLPSAGQP
ncbi:MAG: hypothetical protein ACOCYE_05855, partial [Pseudomonadota bacterium]